MNDSEYVAMICIDAETDILGFDSNKRPELTYGKTYLVVRIHPSDKIHQKFYRLVNDRGVKTEYLRSRFVTQEEFREMKLKEIGI